MFLWILPWHNCYLRSDSGLSVHSVCKDEADFFEIWQVQHSSRNTPEQVLGVFEDNCWSVCCWNHPRIVGHGMWNLYHDGAVVLSYCLNFGKRHFRLSNLIHWVCIIAGILHKRRSEAVREPMDVGRLSGYWRDFHYLSISGRWEIKPAIRE